jgi:hypothetical protein
LRVVHGLINLQGHDTLDPLEQACPLDQGIAGLFDVLRHARVQLLNAPGLVFLDSPAWMGFLPALCQQILGEELLLPSIPSWWCGEPVVWAQALRKGLDHGFVPTFPDDGLTTCLTCNCRHGHTVFAATLNITRSKNVGPARPPCGC